MTQILSSRICKKKQELKLGADVQQFLPLGLISDSI